MKGECIWVKFPVKSAMDINHSNLCFLPRVTTINLYLKERVIKDNAICELPLAERFGEEFGEFDPRQNELIRI